MSASIAQNTRILIVGSGLTGSLTCYHLRALAKQKKIVLPIILDVADMARGPGGRMSTTRYGTNNNNLQQANTGAQYLSTSSSKSAALLESMCLSSSSRTTTTTTTTKTKTPQCHLDRVEDPVRRSTHFIADSDDAYTHWLPRDGATNSVVKQFLRGGEPDRVIFGSRLQQMVMDSSSSSTSTIPQLLPLYDSGGTGSSTYDIVILAMPPKDIIKFFNDDKKDPQSQADLHRRTNNRGKKRRAATTPNQRAIVLPNDVLRRLRTPSYVGRYSLALWLHDDDTAFANKAQHAFNTQRCNNNDDPPSPSHPVLDMVSSQEGGRVLVAQSTVKLWRRLTNTRGGGRHVAKSSLLEALERLTGDTLPRVKHTKLLNWRTSQVVNSPETTGEGIVTAEGGRLIFTGDWCYESSFEGCNLAAEAAAIAAVDTIRSMAEDGSRLKA